MLQRLYQTPLLGGYCLQVVVAGPSWRQLLTQVQRLQCCAQGPPGSSSALPPPPPNVTRTIAVTLPLHGPRMLQGAWFTAIMFITNIFFIPFMALRAGPQPPEASTATSTSSSSRGSRLRTAKVPAPGSQQLPGWSRALGALGMGLGGFCFAWALWGRPEWGDMAARWAYFQDMAATNRVRRVGVEGRMGRVLPLQWCAAPCARLRACVATPCGAAWVSRTGCRTQCTRSTCCCHPPVDLLRVLLWYRAIEGFDSWALMYGMVLDIRCVCCKYLLLYPDWPARPPNPLQVFWAFLVDMALFYTWQLAFLEAAPARFRLVPFFGLAGWLLNGGTQPEQGSSNSS